MNQFSANRGFPAGNPIANALVIIVGTLVIAASLVLGFFAFIVLSAVLLVLAAVIGVRMWWFRRKLRKAGVDPDTFGPEHRKPEGVIEGEYQVVVEKRGRDQS